MNTTANTVAHTAATMTTAHSQASIAAPAGTRLASAAFAGLLTLAMLLGVNSLAQVDGPAAQMAKAPAAAASGGARS